MALSSLKILSYNCRGFNVSKVPCIQELLDISDIVLIQESWLFTSQFAFFTNFFHGYKSVNICGMEETILQAGRPHGGCSILYNALCDNITPIYLCDSKRACGIQYKINDTTIHIFTVYLPCDNNNSECQLDYNNVLSDISSYCMHNNVEHLIIGGDFNTDLSRARSCNTISLNTFIRDECLLYCLNSASCSPIIDYTYFGPTGSSSIIDHFIVSQSLLPQLMCYRTVHALSNISDHIPVFLEIKGHSPVINNSIDNVTITPVSRPIWSSATVEQIASYKSRLDDHLHSIIFSHDLIICNDFHCNSSEHRSQLDVLYMSMIRACMLATEETIPCSTGNTKPKHLPGWDGDLDLAREQSLFWHFIWVSCGRLETGHVADVMRYTRNHYHSLIRKIKKDRDSAVRRSLGTALSQDSTREYWTEVKKISKGKLCMSTNINGLSEPMAIANSFADQYRDLYSSVPSDPDYLPQLLMRIDKSIVKECVNKHDGIHHNHNIDSIHVRHAVRSLGAGKTDGIDNLYSDNFKHATDYFIHCITIIFNSMLCHGYAPHSFLCANVVPIPKNVRLDLSDSSNYRAIALSCVFGKILDKVTLSMEPEHLKTSDYQFGFKAKSSTIMCSTVLIETVQYYVSNNSSVYVLLIDASKAFDRVCHATLFNLLESYKICPMLLRLLCNIYSRSDMNVKWKNTLSSSFALQNGVKQGGVLSPFLFTVYLDGLLKRLKESGVGCHIGFTYAGAFGYADDIALVSPSLIGLRKMISICETYATEYSIMFNPNKSKLLCFNPCIDVIPSVMFCNKIVEVVDSELHLGNRIYSNIYKKNSEEMVSDFYRRSNQVRANFRMCDSVTLNNLHSTYCTSYYGIELYNFNEDYIQEIYVAWRRCIRLVFRLPPRAHNFIVSNLSYCITERLDRRLAKYVYNLLHSSNDVVKSIITSKLLLCPRSIVSENYKYLQFKYNLGHLDWKMSLSHVLGRIHSIPCRDHLITVNTLLELCEIRDRVAYCDVVNNMDHIQTIIDSLCTS